MIAPYVPLLKGLLVGIEPAMPYIDVSVISFKSVILLGSVVGLHLLFRLPVSSR